MGLAVSRQEAFWEACGFGHFPKAREFLEAGDVDVNWVSYTNDCCPIHVASQGKPEIVDLLLEYRCDVNVKDNRGNLALHHAAMRGHSDIVKKLIDAGSEIDTQEKNGWTPLHNAAYWCQPDVVSVLIKSGCDVNIQNKDHRTALHECARSQQLDNRQLGLIATMLIDAGSDVDAKSSDRGEADLTGLMYAAYHNHPEVASSLIAADCHLDDVGSTFWSALHWAADRGHDELVYILLEAGADPTKKGMRGETAMDRAQSDGIRDIISTAMDLYRELHKVPLSAKPAAVAARPKPVVKYTPKCDANFKSESFLPKDWKSTSSPVDIKNLINEKKSRLAAMTSEQYRKDLALKTGARSPISDEADVSSTSTSGEESSEAADRAENEMTGEGDNVKNVESETKVDVVEKGDNESANVDNVDGMQSELISEIVETAEGDGKGTSSSGDSEIHQDNNNLDNRQNSSSDLEDTTQKSEEVKNETNSEVSISGLPPLDEDSANLIASQVEKMTIEGEENNDLE